MTTQMHEASLWLFDWSGTASDDIQHVHRANMLLLERYGAAPVSLEQWRTDAEMMNASSYLAELRGERPDDFYPQYAEILDDVMDGRPPELIPGVRQLLEAFGSQKKRSGVISSHHQEHLDREIDGHRIREHIQFAIGSVVSKTATIIEVCNRFNAAPEQTLFVGDTVQDMQQAKAAGVLAVGYCGPGGYHPRELLELEADLVVSSHTALRGLATAA